MGERALLGLTGLISVALSLVFAIRPDVTVVTIAEVYGLFSIVAAISSMVTGASLRTATPLRAGPMRELLTRSSPDVHRARTLVRVTTEL